jgi:hypothetical protein
VNDVLKRIWKEVVVAYFRVLSKSFPVIANEHNETAGSIYLALGPESNPRPPKYETEVIPSLPQHSVKYF